MSRIIFEHHQMQEFNTNKGTYFLVSRPPRQNTIVQIPETKAPSVDYADQFIGFSFQTFLTSPEVNSSIALRPSRQPFSIPQV